MRLFYTNKRQVTKAERQMPKPETAEVGIGFCNLGRGPSLSIQIANGYSVEITFAEIDSLIAARTYYQLPREQQDDIVRRKFLESIKNRGAQQ